jgi:hypothetical protein
LSGLGCLVLIGIVVLALFRRGRTRWEGLFGDADWELLPTPPNDPVRRLAWRPAALLAVAVLVGAGYVFAWRAGVALGIGTLACVRIGVNVRRLLALALAGLIAIPILYVIDPAPDVGGFFFGYAQHFLNAHWVAVGAVVCLLAAGLLGAAELRRDRRTSGTRRTDGVASSVDVGPIAGVSTATAARDAPTGEEEATPGPR